MKRRMTVVVLGVLCMLWQSTVVAQSGYSEAFESRVRTVLEEMKAPGSNGTYHSIPDEDGRILRLAIRLTQAKRALEVGTSTGYSALWMGLGLKETGGTLTTIEIDKERHALAQDNIEKSGLDDIITAVLGDAGDVIPDLEGPFDVAFVDLGNGELSRKFLDMIMPKLRSGGVVMFHAVRGNRGGMPAFMDYLAEHPQLDTFVLPITRAGISLSYKVR
jgi:caffeoyl-CoA O-methyltransferase